MIDYLKFTVVVALLSGAFGFLRAAYKDWRENPEEYRENMKTLWWGLSTIEGRALLRQVWSEHRR